ncbi:MAG: hypothetical protein LBJ93_03380 [Clostridiales bacterium]|jgi:hypothetical protein|nr:hypothetical protein [Clostridiales bacterium]
MLSSTELNKEQAFSNEVSCNKMFGLEQIMFLDSNSNRFLFILICALEYRFDRDYSKIEKKFEEIKGSSFTTRNFDANECVTIADTFMISEGMNLEQRLNLIYVASLKLSEEYDAVGLTDGLREIFRKGFTYQIEP